MTTKFDTSGQAQPDPKFVLKFSHNIIEHLGLKLYQNKPTNVIAELVSNSWDADSQNVWVHLYTDDNGGPLSIVVADNGTGMSSDNLIKNYLIVGKPKRTKDAPAEASLGKRLPMGRKGIGKLAPFGVAKIVDLITVANNKLTWLQFDYGEISTMESNGLLVEYEPKVIAIEIGIKDCIDNAKTPNPIREHLEKILKTSKEAGTIVWAHELTLSRPIAPKDMLESLGRRFTVTLARPDFIVQVNNVSIEEKHVFPNWELRIPETGTLSVEMETPIGKKTIKYWAGFVHEASWSSEQAGVGIYAHGKIAQDRPFFFGNKGNEIFTRYLYAVVEADWIDELENDAISTDRTSIDWENQDFSGLKAWGGDAIKAWLKKYEALRKENATKENISIVDSVLKKNSTLSLRPAERDHLVELLSEVTPRLGKESENREKLIEATAKAWIHEPARKLIKKLWEETSQFEADGFSVLVSRLSEQLIPESLSLAVVFSQRVYALTQLDNHIMLGKETQLQTLIENFPWILDNSFEKYLPRRALTTICAEAERNGLLQNRDIHTVAGENSKPDFVFLGDAEDRDILIVELKGPDAAASWPEDEQLNSYKRFLQSRFTTSTVKGILVAGSFDENVLKQRSISTDYIKWKDVLLRSRRDHMELLAALLAGSEADQSDSRVQQICELGGAPVKNFLKDMSKSTPELSILIEKLSPAKT
ncbi:ATP-binding protein [Undibacterium sp. CY7W]|uniref:ATP-binding protein n=1 Tax=Undibacterium rugosum TaxID=2762291 RepID=A0A923I615_9BURK|nr:ATP-binding protein [Undibacterium rugosum]MBC3937000.1 ATP-binding protein [Undibacterium rugosum]